tara:strand:- start:45 stop:500 length:456 start_codon:yes stop_codon:yes gene_type:complete
MFDPITLGIMAVSTGLQMKGQLDAGKSSEEQSKLNAFRMETETKLGKVQASQEAMARREEYDIASKSNYAQFAASGRDIGSDMSVKAFMDKQKETLGEDIRRGDVQAQLERNRGAEAAGAERASGRNARRASLINAASTAIGGGLDMYRTK